MNWMKKRKSRLKDQETLKTIQYVFLNNAERYTRKTIQKYGYEPFYILDICKPRILMFTFNQEKQEFKFWDRYIYNEELPHYLEYWTEVKLKNVTLEQIRAIMRSYEIYKSQ